MANGPFGDLSPGAYMRRTQDEARKRLEGQQETYGKAFEQALGMVAPPTQQQPKLQTGAEGQMWQGIAQQQQQAAQLANRRGYNPLAARAATQAGSELEQAGYGMAQQLRASEEAGRREAALQVLQGRSQFDAQAAQLGGSQLQETLAAKQFEDLARAKLEKQAREEEAGIGQGILSALGSIGSTALGAFGSDENMKQNIRPAGKDLDMVMGTLGGYGQQSGEYGDQFSPRTMTVYTGDRRIVTPAQQAGIDVYDEAQREIDAERAPVVKPGSVVFAPERITGRVPVEAADSGAPVVRPGSVVFAPERITARAPSGPAEGGAPIVRPGYVEFAPERITASAPVPSYLGSGARALDQSLAMPGPDAGPVASYENYRAQQRAQQYAAPIVDTARQVVEGAEAQARRTADERARELGDALRMSNERFVQQLNRGEVDTSAIAPATGQAVVSFAKPSAVDQRTQQLVEGLGETDAQMQRRLKSSGKKAEPKLDIGTLMGELGEQQSRRLQRGQVDATMRQVEPVTYEYRAGEGPGGQRAGILAQDLAKTPLGAAAVRPMGNGRLGVDIGQATALGVAGAARANQRMDELEKKLKKPAKKGK